MSGKPVPKIVFEHPADYLSSFSVPMPSNQEGFYDLVEKADRGNTDANWMLAVIYTANKQFPEAMARYRLSINLNDNRKAASLSNLGMLYQQKGDHSTANQLFEEAGAQGNFLGYKNIATNYFLGNGIPKNYEIAYAYFKKSAALGCADCQWTIDHWDDAVAMNEKNSQAAAKK